MFRKQKIRNKQLIKQNEELQKKVIDLQVNYNKLEEQFINYKNKVNNKQ